MSGKYFVSFYIVLPTDQRTFSKYIREWCWVLNQSGKDDGFLAYDIAQEENICDIKVHYILPLV